MEDYTATGLRRLEDEFYADCAARLNATYDVCWESLLDQMLLIANQQQGK